MTDRKDTSNPTRRRILSAGVVATSLTAMGAAVAAPAIGVTSRGDDPVLRALAELKRVRAWMDPIGKKFAEAENASLRSDREFLGLQIDGATLRNVHEIDRHFSPASREDLEDTIARLERARDAALTKQQIAARAGEKAKAMKELERQCAAHKSAMATPDFAFAEREWNAATSKEELSIMAVFAAKPTTTAGAIALLRFVADEQLGFASLDAEVGPAILAACAAIEGEACI
jgi:hypothetical protein